MISTGVPGVQAALDERHGIAASIGDEHFVSLECDSNGLFSTLSIFTTSLFTFSRANKKEKMK